MHILPFRIYSNEEIATLSESRASQNETARKLKQVDSIVMEESTLKESMPRVIAQVETT